MTIDQDKQALRRLAILRRDALAHSARDEKSAAICAELSAALKSLGLGTACAKRTVAVYAAMGSEADPSSFARAAEDLGCTVSYPCMLPRNEADACGQRMCMRAVCRADAASVPFIAQPTRALASHTIDSTRFPVVPAETIDLIVVPLVAFDAHGMRLGYGGGCYDRYLPELRPDCQVIGIAFEEQRVSRVPGGPHDLALPRIISA